MNKQPKSRNHPAVEPDETAARSLELINSQNTMTLATARGDSAWAAPVYYVFHSCFFYFFSDPESRHIQEGLAAVESSAAIHADSKEWRDICGIQMTGKIERVAMGREAAAAFSAYLKKFPFCKDFFAPGSLMKLESFSGRFKARLYKFHPTLVYYQDNRIKFGHREPIDLPNCKQSP